MHSSTSQDASQPMCMSRRSLICGLGLGAGAGTSFRDRLRKLCEIPPNDRLKAFYGARFGSNKANVDATFKRIAYGLGVGSFEDVGFTLFFLGGAADFKEVPTEEQRRALTSAFADRLAQGVEDEL